MTKLGTVLLLLTIFYVGAIVGEENVLYRCVENGYFIGFTTTLDCSLREMSE